MNTKLAAYLTFGMEKTAIGLERAFALTRLLGKPGATVAYKDMGGAGRSLFKGPSLKPHSTGMLHTTKNTFSPLRPGEDPLTKSLATRYPGYTGHVANKGLLG